MTATPGSQLDRLYATLHRSPLRRSNRGIVGGICAGIAEELGVPTALVRVGTVATIILGPGLALYLLAWLFLPSTGDRLLVEEAVRRHDLRAIALVALTVIVLIPNSLFKIHVGPLAVILAIVTAIAWHRGRRNCVGTTPNSSAPPYSGAPQYPGAPPYSGAPQYPGTPPNASTSPYPGPSSFPHYRPSPGPQDSPH